MHGCTDRQHVHLAAPHASQETLCLTCFSSHVASWSAAQLFTSLCRVTAALAAAQSTRQPPSDVTTCREALAELTARLAQRVSTPDSLRAEHISEEESRLRGALLQWLRVVYTSTRTRPVSPSHCAAGSQRDPCVLGAESAEHVSQRTGTDSPSLSSLVTQTLLRQLSVCFTQLHTPHTTLAARVLFLTDLCASCDGAGEAFLQGVCAGHLDEVVALLPTAVHRGGDDTLMELLLFWLHQICVACRATPVSLERLAGAMVNAGGSATSATAAPEFVSSLIACVVDWGDSEPVVLNALSLLVLLLSAVTTAHSLVVSRNSDSSTVTEVPRNSWDPLARVVVPLLLHCSEAVAALAADVATCLVAHAARFGGLSSELRIWAEDCALEATNEVTASTAESLLALLSTLHATSSAANDTDDTANAERAARVLDALYQFAGLSSPVCISAHDCAYFAAHLGCRNRDGGGIDAEAFATRCLRFGARADHHDPAVRTACFLQQLQWLCGNNGTHVAALLPETIEALSQALLCFLTVPTGEDAWDAFDLPRVLWRIESAMPDLGVLACVMHVTASLASATTTGSESAVHASLGRLAVSAIRLALSLSWSTALWSAAMPLTCQLLRAVSLPQGKLGPAPATASAASTTPSLALLVRDLVECGLLELLLLHAPSDDAAQVAVRELLAVLVCGAPFPVDTTAWLTDDAHSWPELVARIGDGDRGGDVLLFSLAAWGCPTQAVTPEQLRERLAGRVWMCQCTPRALQNTSDDARSATLMPLADHDDDDWVESLACVVMLLWTYQQYVQVLPTLDASMLCESSDSHQTPVLWEPSSLLLDKHAQQQWRPLQLWWPTMLSKEASGDISGGPDSFARALVEHDQWQPLGCALLLVSYLEREPADGAGEANCEAVWWLHDMARQPASCAVATTSPPLHALVSAALTHVQWVCRVSRAARSHASHRVAQDLLKLVQRALAEARLVADRTTHNATPTAAAVDVAVADVSRTLHRRVLERHLRPLLLAAPPPASAPLHGEVSTATRDADLLEDAVATTCVTTLAGLGRRELGTVAAVALKRAVSALESRLSAYTGSPATGASRTHRSLAVWLQLTYMLLLCRTVPGEARETAPATRAPLLPLVPPLRAARCEALRQLQEAHSDRLDACRVMALSALLECVIHTTAAVGSPLARTTSPVAVPLPSPSWWTLLPLEALDKALRTSTTPRTSGTPDSVSERAQCTELLLHVLAQLIAITDTGKRGGPASVEVAVEELAAVEWALNGSLVVLGAAATITTTTTELDTVDDDRTPSPARPGHERVARLVASLFQRYRHVVSGSLHLPALCAMCRCRLGGGLSVVTQGWLLSGVLCAAPRHAWLLSLPTPSRDAVLRDLLEGYGAKITVVWSRKRRSRDDRQDFLALSRALVRACEQYCPHVAADTPVVLTRIQDFLCPPLSTGARPSPANLPSSECAEEECLFYSVGGGSEIFLAS